MPVHCEKDLRLQVALTDSSGRRFDNFSSLALEWSVSSSLLASILHQDTLQTEEVMSEEGVRSVRSYQTLRPYGRTGTVFVTATISSYKKEYLRQAAVSFSAQVTIDVEKGSGYFYLREIESQVLQVSYLAKSKSVLVEVQKEVLATVQVLDAHGQTIYSQPKPIEVIATGGPQPQSNVQFSILDSGISSVSSSGLLEALSLGTTRVVGKAVGVDPLTGESVVYSQMPVYAVGLTEHETPFSFGASMPPLTFTWSVNSREVLRLESVYHDVFDKLQLTTPSICDGQIRLTPNTETSIRTNRDVAADMSYTVVSENGDMPTVRVGKNGQLVSGPIPGSAVVHVTAQEEFGINQTLVFLVKVTASDPTLLEVLSPETDPQSGAVVLYPVRLRDSLSLWEREQLDLSVELSNARTGQKQRVPILVKLVGQKPETPRMGGQYRQDVGWGYLLRSMLANYQSWFALLLIILATGAAVLVDWSQSTFTAATSVSTVSFTFRFT
nr:hypothetical protein BaRGS_003378 [Batillaria attramentaria]